MSRVFLSHASRDKEVARELAAALSSAGHEVWLDESALQPGDQILPTIAQAIENSDAVVVLVSEAAQSSMALETEAALAAGKVLSGRGGVVIPILLGRGAELPYSLQTFQALRLDPTDPVPEKLLRALDSSPSTHRLKDHVFDLQRDAIEFQRRSLDDERERYEVLHLERQGRLSTTLTVLATVLAAAVVIALAIVRRDASVAALSGAATTTALITALTAMASLALRRSEIRRLRERVRYLETRLLAAPSEQRVGNDDRP